MFDGSRFNYTIIFYCMLSGLLISVFTEERRAEIITDIVKEFFSKLRDFKFVGKSA